MKNDNHHHWTTDDVLLRDFILRKLPTNQVSDLNDHLKDCSECSNLVANEMRIIAAARRLGRNDMKQRLSGELDNRQSIPWPRVLSAAAVIVVIVGVGTYYQWLTPVKKNSFLTDSVEQPIEQLKDAGEQIESQGSRVRELEDQDEKNIVIPEESTQMSSELDAKKRAEVIGGTSGRSSVARSPAPVTAEDKAKSVVRKDDMDAVRAAASLETAGNELAKESGDKLDEPEIKFGENIQTAWVTGKKQSGPGGNFRPYGRDKETLGLTQSSTKSSDARKQETGQAMDDSKSNLPIRIEQRRMNEMPQVQLSRQTALGIDGVQSLIEQTPAGLQLTLFFESEMDSVALSNATVEQITEDSLVVFVGGEAIAYKLPPGFAGQVVRTKR